MFDISQPYILHAFFSIHNLCGYNHVGHFLTVEIKKKIIMLSIIPVRKKINTTS